MDYILPLVAGFVGSMHCVGMCGAIVLAYSFQGGAASRPSLALSMPMHLAYNAGRVVSYTLIGALVGFLGGMISSIQTFGTWFSLVAGALMIVTGILMLDLVPGVRLWEGGETGWLRKLHLQSVANLLSLRTLESKFYIGLLTPFLPCGLLYSMFLNAASTGNALHGGLTMLLFGAGIVPALLLTGMVSSFVGVKIRYYANKVAAVTIILMGVTIIMRGAGIPLPFMGGMHSHHGSMGGGMMHEHVMPADSGAAMDHSMHHEMMSMDSTGGMMDHTGHLHPMPADSMGEMMDHSGHHQEMSADSMAMDHSMHHH